MAPKVIGLMVTVLKETGLEVIGPVATGLIALAVITVPS